MRSGREDAAELFERRGSGLCFAQAVSPERLHPGFAGGELNRCRAGADRADEGRSEGQELEDAGTAAVAAAAASAAGAGAEEPYLFALSPLARIAEVNQFLD